MIRLQGGEKCGLAFTLPAKKRPLSRLQFLFPARKYFHAVPSVLRFILTRNSTVLPHWQIPTDTALPGFLTSESFYIPFSLDSPSITVIIMIPVQGHILYGCANYGCHFTPQEHGCTLTGSVKATGEKDQHCLGKGVYPH